MSSIFHALLGRSYIFFGALSIEMFCPFSHWVISLFYDWVIKDLSLISDESLIKPYDLEKKFSNFAGCLYFLDGVFETQVFNCGVVQLILVDGSCEDLVYAFTLCFPPAPFLTRSPTIRSEWAFRTMGPHHPSLGKPSCLGRICCKDVSFATDRAVWAPSSWSRDPWREVLFLRSGSYWLISVSAFVPGMHSPDCCGFTRSIDIGRWEPSFFFLSSSFFNVVLAILGPLYAHVNF